MRFNKRKNNSTSGLTDLLLFDCDAGTEHLLDSRGLRPQHLNPSIAEMTFLLVAEITLSPVSASFFIKIHKIKISCLS